MTRIFAIALFVGACTSPPVDYGGVPDRESRRAELTRVERFATVLSRRAEPDSLADYDLAILDPDLTTVDDVRKLRAGGTLSLGYVNIGEVEEWRSFADRVEPAWLLGENPHWPGHQFVDAREPGWRRLVTDVIATRVVATEFDGLFLDMADVAAPELFPDTVPGVVALVKALRELYPDHLIVMNRGLFLTDRVGADIDGLLVEGVWGRLNLEAGTTDRTLVDESRQLLAGLDAFRQATGGAVFVIDYADTDSLRAHVLDSAHRAGLPVFVSRAALADLPLVAPRRAW